MKAKHRPCDCGCGELADECMNPASPWGAFTFDQPIGSVQPAGSNRPEPEIDNQQKGDSP